MPDLTRKPPEHAAIDLRRLLLSVLWLVLLDLRWLSVVSLSSTVGDTYIKAGFPERIIHLRRPEPPYFGQIPRPFDPYAVLVASSPGFLIERPAAKPFASDYKIGRAHV